MLLFVAAEIFFYHNIGRNMSEDEDIFNKFIVLDYDDSEEDNGDNPQQKIKIRVGKTQWEKLAQFHSGMNMTPMISREYVAQTQCFDSSVNSFPINLTR